MLKARLLDGVTYERLGEMYDMSPRRVVDRIKKAREIVFRHADKL